MADLKQRSVPQSPIATVFTLEQIDSPRLKEVLASPSDVVLARPSLDLMSIVNAVESILAGVRFVDPAIPFAIRNHELNGNHVLSEQERRVLQLLCNGLTNKGIGETLSIAETTARGHVQSIMRKLNVRDRTAAAVEGIRRHWVD